MKKPCIAEKAAVLTEDTIQHHNEENAEQNQKISKLILKLIGTVGAVDPYLVKQIKQQSDQAEVEGDSPDILWILP